MRLPSHTRFAALLGAGSLLLAAPSVAEEAHEEERAQYDQQGDHGDERGHEEEAVRLAPEVLAEFGVEVAIAGPGVIVRHVSLPAEVRPNQDGLAHLAPRFPGVATEVRRTVGDIVKAGETLAIVEASQSLSKYPIKTLIDGVVIERHVTRGEPVSLERGPLVTVADLGTVWVDASVYQRNLLELAMGQRVRVSAGHGLAQAEGVLSYIAPVVDEKTRTATARVVLANPDGLWRPGMFVTAEVEVEREEVSVAVPRSALASVEGRPTVFVQTADGLEPRPVRVGRTGEDLVEILSGLTAGERYAARGSFTLQSELAREELSGGHSH
jgi:cobalt-zinc-cadmium efflux system membrane fusion protein